VTLDLLDLPSQAAHTIARYPHLGEALCPSGHTINRCVPAARARSHRRRGKGLCRIAHL